MSILDLQGMATSVRNAAPAGSRGSKNCFNNSNYSVLLCDIVL
jgi:hypothetical protein